MIHIKIEIDKGGNRKTVDLISKIRYIFLNINEIDKAPAKLIEREITNIQNY